MISREPTIERLATARGCCSSPSASTKATCRERWREITRAPASTTPTCTSSTRAARAGASRKASSRRGSFSIDQGVGVRAVAGEKTAFAYSDDISEAALLDAARDRAHDRGGRAEPAASRSRRRRRSPAAASLYAPIDPIAHARQHRRRSRCSRSVEKLRARQGPAHRAGDGGPGRRIRRGAGRARRRHARRRRAAAGAPVGHGDRRAERPRARSAPAAAAAASASATSTTRCIESYVDDAVQRGARPTSRRARRRPAR